MTRFELLKEFKARVEDGVSGGVDLDHGDLRYIQRLLDDIVVEVISNMKEEEDPFEDESDDYDYDVDEIDILDEEDE